MRLIDADALYDEVSDHVTSVSVCATAQQAIGQTDFKWRCLEDIRSATTIDAIPVEWLKNRREGLIFAAMTNSSVYGNNTIELCHAVNMVLDMWREEQEAR